MFRKLTLTVAGLAAAAFISLAGFSGATPTQAANLPGESTAANASAIDPDDHFWFRAGIIEAAAETIGVRPEVVRDGLRRGRSLDEIAFRHGVGEERLERGILHDESEDLARRVAEGKMSWERADAIIDWLSRHIDQIVRYHGDFDGVLDD